MDSNQKVTPPDETMSQAMAEVAQDWASRKTDACCNCLHGGRPSLSDSCLTCVPPAWENWRPRRSPVIYHYAESKSWLGRLIRMITR